MNKYERSAYIFLTSNLFKMSVLHIGHDATFSEHFQQQHKCPHGINKTLN